MGISTSTTYIYWPTCNWLWRLNEVSSVSTLEILYTLVLLFVAQKFVMTEQRNCYYLGIFYATNNSSTTINKVGHEVRTKQAFLPCACNASETSMSVPLQSLSSVTLSSLQAYATWSQPGCIYICTSTHVCIKISVKHFSCNWLCVKFILHIKFGLKMCCMKINLITVRILTWYCRSKKFWSGEIFIL